MIIEISTHRFVLMGEVLAGAVITQHVWAECPRWPIKVATQIWPDDYMRSPGQLAKVGRFLL